MIDPSRYVNLTVEQESPGAEGLPIESGKLLLHANKVVSFLHLIEEGTNEKLFTTVILCVQLLSTVPLLYVRKNLRYIVPILQLSIIPLSLYVRDNVSTQIAIGLNLPVLFKSL